ncbi:hypothetical protein AK812_SmicGene4142 [Symbiodinium microadriaticum]|uniref:Uncharacterized protein n=1 Tax=Symbiodinium microadriaticum TaxID=2951 RepID=A0A1Q9EXC5_SYMMI|nr:hypothetical protein AK812_SmicGene4142 [Symbiodinium microadriaticum]
MLLRLPASSPPVLQPGAAPAACSFKPHRHASWPLLVSAAAAVPSIARRIPRCAVAEGGEHCGAVRAWLDEFVIGRGFCPWARPAEKRRNIRIVESTGKDPDEVIFDLLAEAEALPEGPGFDGGATLLGKLGSGFLEEFDMKVIAFHPKYLRYGFSVEEGDRVAIANADGTSSSALVLDEEGGVHPDDGEELLDVRFDDGQEFLVRYSSIITKLAVDDDGEERAADDSSGDAANLLSRAPRPTFHLLRMEDLEGAGDADRSGTGPKIKDVLADNARRASDLGLSGMDELLESCG